MKINKVNSRCLSPGAWLHIDMYTNKSNAVKLKLNILFYGKEKLIIIDHYRGKSYVPIRGFVKQNENQTNT